MHDVCDLDDEYDPSPMPVEGSETELPGGDLTVPHDIYFRPPLWRSSEVGLRLAKFEAYLDLEPEVEHQKNRFDLFFRRWQRPAAPDLGHEAVAV